MAKKNTAQICEELAQPIAESMGLALWDVRFEKEGGGWFLRFFVDKEGGVTIEDCENFSRALDPVLDQHDPIEQAYCLEVSSPGIERELKRPWHFEHCLGQEVKARLIRAKEGRREFVGKLLSYHDGDCEIETQAGSIKIMKGEAAYIRIHYDFEQQRGERP